MLIAECLLSYLGEHESSSKFPGIQLQGFPGIQLNLTYLGLSDRHSVERLLDSVDAVVYILDYTKLKTSEEADLLAKLKEANPQLVRRLAERLFFVVNKIDSMHSNAGLQEEELCEYVADLITKQMNCPEFQLKPEQAGLPSLYLLSVAFRFAKENNAFPEPAPPICRESKLTDLLFLMVKWSMSCSTP